MTDNEIRALLREMPAVTGWPRRERAWPRARVEEVSADLAAIDARVVRVGGSIEEYQPRRMLPRTTASTPCLRRRSTCSREPSSTSDEVACRSDSGSASRVQRTPLDHGDRLVVGCAVTVRLRRE